MLTLNEQDSESDWVVEFVRMLTMHVNYSLGQLYSGLKMISNKSQINSHWKSYTFNTGRERGGGGGHLSTSIFLTEGRSK